MLKPAQTFVGRAVELESLDDALDGLQRERRAQIVELAGEPGIGKTRLLAELGDRADRRGLPVLSGSAAELERGAAAFEAIGAPRYLAEAEQALVRLGRRRHRRTRPGAPESGGVESLTQRELEVARLIVDRRTNAQIAAELFLSTKTVETHIRHLFHKLGVSSRVEVARAIERSDLRARASLSAARQDSAPARRGGRI